MEKIKNWIGSGQPWARGIKVFVVIYIISFAIAMIVRPLGLIHYIVFFSPLLIIADVVGLRGLLFGRGEPVPSLTFIGWVGFIIFWFIVSATVSLLWARWQNHKKVTQIGQ